jgi:2,3-bisphosphoglycerate-independent phosphoglycerate mutase
MRQLRRPAQSKIVMLVMDGLGGLPAEWGDFTELEAAATPNLDDLAKNGLCGLQVPVAPGVTPGSGPAHLALFGYDPVEYQVGRGVLSALGIDFALESGDLAARGNFCTLDEKGRVSDRRAGRLSTSKNRELCRKLRRIEIDGAELFVQTVKEYRFLLVLRTAGLRHEIGNTDPQEIGVRPLEPAALDPGAQESAELVQRFVEAARDLLRDEQAADMVLLRGFSQRPEWPQMSEVFGLRCAAVAGYPMYRGVAALVGMSVLENAMSLPQQIESLEAHWQDFDFFYVHVKPIDSAGEDGDFDRKVSLIEEVDRHLPPLLGLKPDVLVVTGDHSTPAVLKRHSWHPVPVILHSGACRPDSVKRFGERDCLHGGLGPMFPARDLLPLALANAGCLKKFGA